MKRKMAPYWRPSVILVHGDADLGGDKLADTIWRSWGGQTERHPVTSEDWEQYGKKAGPRRNEYMVSLGADQWIGFPVGGRKESPGTWGCRDIAEAAGIPVEIIPYEPRVFTFPVHTEDW